MKKVLFLVVVLAMLVSLTIPFAAPAVATDSTSSATITTDKNKYSLPEPMLISGSGFTPGDTVNITVQLPGNNGLDSLSATADAAGSFLTVYSPPMIPGRYKIVATDNVNTAMTAATEADATNEDFYGWNMSSRGVYPTWPGDWTKGDLGKNWREGDWVSYVFILNGYDGAPLPSGFKIRYDFLQASSGGILVDLARNFSYKFRDPYSGSGIPTDVTPANFQTWRDGTFTPSEINVPCDGAGNPIPDGQNNPGDFAYFTLDSSAFGTIPTGQSLVIYFELHLAQTFVWSNGLESLYNNAPYNAWGGTRYASWTTTAWLGSGYVSGSSGHANEIGGGAKTVPIPVPPKPPGMVSGYKWQDNNMDGIWDAGEPALSGWRIYIYGTGDNSLFHDEMLTDGSGAYSFPNLTEGTWLIKEASQREVPASTGWQQSYPVVGSIQGSGTGIAVSPPPTGVSGCGWSVVLTDASPTQGNLNFGNYLYGCLQITKSLSIPAGVPLAPLDGTFTIHVAGPGGYSQDVNFTMVDGVITSTNPVELGNLTPGVYTLTEPSPPANWTPSGLGNVTVSAGASCATKTVTNTYVPGCLQITKSLSIPAGVPLAPLDGTFTIHVAGPFSYSHDVNFTMVDGVITSTNPVELDNLIPGVYTLTEPSPPANWTPTGLGNVTVNSGASCATKTVTNTYVPGCLEITKAVDFGTYMYPNTVSGNFTVNVSGPAGYTNSHVFQLVNGVLQAPTTWTLDNLIPGTYSVVEVNPGPYWTVTYNPASGNASVVSGTSCAGVTVTNKLIISPCTELTITADPPEVALNGFTTLTVTENNCGNVSLTNVQIVLSGDTSGILDCNSTSPIVFSGDTSNSCVLDPGETWQWTGIVVQVTTATGGNYTATGHGLDPFGNDITYPDFPKEQGNVTVGLWKPQTVVTITPSVWETSPGENVILTITETNTGDVALGDAYVVLDPGNITLTSPYSTVPGNFTYFTGTDTGSDGNLSVLENWTWEYPYLITADTTFLVTGHGIAPGNVDITFPAYPSERGNATVTVTGNLTRTQGFWATHLEFTTYVFNKYTGNPPDGNESTPGYIDLGWLPPITNINDLMGVFWANNAKNSDGSKRDALCQAREIASNQALAAILNSSIPGGKALPAGYSLTQIASILHGNNITAIQTLNSVLDAYNNSGEDVAFDSSLPPTGHANPQGAKSIAHIPFADCSNSIGLPLAAVVNSGNGKKK